MRWLIWVLFVGVVVASRPAEARRSGGSDRVDRSTSISSERRHSERKDVHHFSYQDTLRLKSRSRTFRD